MRGKCCLAHLPMVGLHGSSWLSIPVDLFYDLWAP